MRLIDTTGEPNLRSDWRGALGDGIIVRLDEPFGFEHRLGHTWARGRLRTGDLVLCLGQAGDYFHNWYLLDHKVGTMRSDAGVDEPALYLTTVPAPFGAYTMGRGVVRLSAEQLAELLDSGELRLPLPDTYETPPATCAA